MRLLLDTHALLWWWGEPELLSERARAVIAERDHEVWVSAATAWELAIKVHLGKLPDARLAVDHYAEWLGDEGMLPLDIRASHALKAGSLSGAHRDPFDRMLAAQAMIEQLEVVTRDPSIAALGARTIW